MKAKLLILRPEPGASASVARAAAMGLAATAAPIFTIAPLAWRAPDLGHYDAILFTSANAVRHGGDELRRYAHLPCFAVGDATGAAALAAGFAVTAVGRSDGDEIVALMQARGVSRAVHPCGREHISLQVTLDGQAMVEDVAVYAADAVAALPAPATAAIRGGALAALHSPRAARLFGALVDAAGIARETVALVTLSAAVAAAAGEGWKAKAVAHAPRDEALLELAAKLCKNGAAATSVGE